MPPSADATVSLTSKQSGTSHQYNPKSSENLQGRQRKTHRHTFTGADLPFCCLLNQKSFHQGAGRRSVSTSCHSYSSSQISRAASPSNVNAPFGPLAVTHPWPKPGPPCLACSKPCSRPCNHQALAGASAPDGAERPGRCPNGCVNLRLTSLTYAIALCCRAKNTSPGKNLWQVCESLRGMEG